MNGAGVLAVAANQDQNWSRFLLLRPVIMRGELACASVTELSEALSGVTYISPSSSSSDRVGSGGPLRQPGMSTTGGPGPFSADAETGGLCRRRSAVSTSSTRAAWAQWLK